ncbi:hypothetical protein PAESOLCIP111_03974 [Paenibacillus solanacearum]|uniref:Baseplate assembly protein n=1 Tax=Paenibacillus solanacearum TaxID=2048548 RepID=A0A916K6F2_9BACL|nr:putative baseplate assembly protein [Paenibacillus solanacearum]CAG7638761.1 hypothetical protein PAESOLCIP111_03974 [Paenibacillus solanacearum]
MLPLPNLDDRTFEQLVREARDRIPGIFPEWTDQNAHDPGMTLLELLAWHIEMQQFQLAVLTDSHERKFLKLLGESPNDRAPSIATVSCSGAERSVLLPRGTLLRAGELPFETEEPITVMPDPVVRLALYTDEGIYEIPQNFETSSAPFYPFGDGGGVNASMIIAVDEAMPASTPISLRIELAGPEPPHRIPAGCSDFAPYVNVAWSFLEDESEADWQPLPVIRDETYGLCQSGAVTFQLPAASGSVKRIKAHLAEGGYCDPPLIRQLRWNTAAVRQGETLCVSECFDGTSGEAEQGYAHAAEQPSFPLEHALFQTGIVSVQCSHPSGGWTDLEEDKYRIAVSEGRAYLAFADGLLPAGKQTIRAVAVSKRFEGQAQCDRGTGRSGQTLRLAIHPILPDTLRLQVGWIPEGAESVVWFDWQRVPDFDGSDAQSHHYVIDEKEGVIRFSDGVYGAVPPAAPFPNIRVIGYRTGTGESGNVKEHTITQLETVQSGMAALQVTNPYPASGGAEPESVREAMQRASLHIFDPKCGVTAEDLERRAMEVPGLRIARVKTIPGYKPAKSYDSREREIGHISVVIVPYSRQPCPKPTRGMLQTVRRRLEPYRLLTTTLHVIPPEYIKVTVHAVIVADPRYGGREGSVRQALERWLQPYGDGGAAPGWAFGEPIYKSDVYDRIHRVPGVQYIQDVWLTADGNGAYREEGGDIRLPPNGLVISGSHEIEFIMSG